MDECYEGDRFRTAYTKVRDARKGINDLPEGVRGECLSIVTQAVEGTYQACKEIYEPNPNTIFTGSRGDWETDKESLKDLSGLFAEELPTGIC